MEHAIEVGQWLREQGHPFTGIRLDSGDLAYLGKEARKRLDAAGFPQARILASGDLDEELIEDLKQSQHAPIVIWGVGTHLATGGAGVRVGLADGGRSHPDEHLASAGHRPLDLLDVQDLRRPVAILDDGPHHAVSLSPGRGNAGSVGR